MYSGLGVTIGSANSLAVTVFDRAGSRDPQLLSAPTELHVPAGGTPVLGSGEPAPGTEVLTGFPARVGDPVGILTDDGSTHLGEDLVAATLADLQRRTLGDALAPTMLAHPATWSAHAVDSLHAALDRAGVSASTLSEPVAAARWFETVHGAPGDDVTVVYDLGARGLDVAVIGHGAQPTLLGRPLTGDDLSGDHLDHLVTTYLLEELGAAAAGLDPFAPETVAALAGFRAHCRAAREALSSDTETVVPLALPGVRRDVRLVRGEFEELARGPLEASLVLVQDALRAAGVDLSDVGRVLLTGGGSSTPLVTELISSELGLPVVMAARPAFTAAHGAALAAAAPVAERTPAMSRLAPVEEDDAATVVLPAVTEATAAPEPVAAHRPAVVDTTASGSRGRRFALVGAAVAAVAVLAGGGLALGTLSSDADTPGTGTRPTTETVAENTGSPAPTTGAVVAEPGTTQPTTPGTTETVRVVNSDGSVTVVPVAATPGTPGAPAPANPAAVPAGETPAPDGSTPAPESPAAPAPEVPAVPQPTQQQPAPAPAPAPSAPQSGVGDALTGAGRGAGAVVEGVGNGLGRVLDGTGNVVGGVLGGTGQVVGGLLGTGR